MSETIVMIGTVGVVLATHNLALGVGVGVVLSAIFFSRKIAKVIRVESLLDGATRTRTYTVVGQVFFVSSEEFLASFDTSENLEAVVLDLTHAHLWDATAVAAIDKLVLRFRARGARVTLRGVNEDGAVLLAKLATHDRPGARLGSH